MNVMSRGDVYGLDIHKGSRELVHQSIGKKGIANRSTGMIINILQVKYYLIVLDSEIVK